MRTLRMTLAPQTAGRVERVSHLSSSPMETQHQYFDFMYTTQTESDSIFQTFFFLFLGNIEYIESRDSSLVGIWLLLIAVLLFSLLTVISFLALSNINPVQLLFFFSLVSFLLNFAFTRSVELSPFPENQGHFRLIVTGACFFAAGVSCILVSINLVGPSVTLAGLTLCVVPGVFVDIFIEKFIIRSMMLRMTVAIVGAFLAIIPLVYPENYWPFSSDFYSGIILSFIGGLLFLKPVHVISCKVQLENLVQISQIFLFGLILILPLGLGYYRLSWPSLGEWLFMLFGGILLIPIQYYLVRGLQLEPISSSLHVFLVFVVVNGGIFLLLFISSEFWYLFIIGSLLVLGSFVYGIQERNKEIKYSGKQLGLLESEARNSKEMLLIK